MLGIHRNSLSYKTAILYVVLAVIIISVFNFIIWENQSELLLENQKWIVELQSSKLRGMIEGTFENSENESRRKIFEEINDLAINENVMHTSVYSEGGKVLYVSSEERTVENFNRELVLVNRCIARFELENKKFLHDTDVKEGIIALYLPISVLDGSEIMVFKLIVPLLEFSQRKNDVLKVCAAIAIFICLLQLVMAFVLRKWIIRPIRSLVDLTNRVSKGDLSQQIRLEQNDEIGHLATAYNNMVHNLDSMQKEAKGANPLSGLPGNISIMNTIDQRLATGEKISVIYGDLDNFKAYNDKYGLTKGDEAILHTRDAFINAVQAVGAKDVFVGHEGGDDFVVVCPYDYWEVICKKIVDLFDKDIHKFYNEEDSLRGYIDSKDRQGNPVRYPLMSISLAVVGNHYRQTSDHRILIQWAAEMKKVVKKIEGSSYAIDSRRR